MLYADAWFRQQDFTRAKTIYLMLRKQVSSDEYAAVLKKIQLCNRALHLPDPDGIVD